MAIAIDKFRVILHRLWYHKQELANIWTIWLILQLQLQNRHIRCRVDSNQWKISPIVVIVTNFPKVVSFKNNHQDEDMHLKILMSERAS